MSQSHIKNATILPDVRQDQPLATIPDALPTTIQDGPAALFAAIVALAKDPAVDAAKVQAFLAMQERLEERQAEREFNTAMTAAQAEMSPVVRDAENKENHSKYATLYAVDKMVRPIYLKHGFSLSFGSEAVEGNNVRITLDTSHNTGHTKRTYFDAPPDTLGPKGSPVKTQLHGLGSTMTYLRNRLICSVFNIVLKGDKDDDDGNRGGARLIDAAQCGELQDLIAKAGYSEREWLERRSGTGIRSVQEVQQQGFVILKNMLLQIIRQREAGRGKTDGNH